jgi:hypothetical protein
VLFLLIIFGVSIVGFAMPDKELSQSERRPLADFPQYSSSEKGFNSDVKSYIKDFEDYALDQFPLRDTMRNVKAFVELKLFGKKDNKDLYIVDGVISEMQPTLNEKSVQNAISVWNNIFVKYLEDKADNVLLSVIPDKNYFMAEKNGYLAYDYEKMISMLKDGCAGFEYVDIFEKLELDDYYKTDTHWRQEEIVEVARTLAEALGVADEYSWAYDVNELDVPFYGVYAGQLGLSVESETIYYLTNKVLSECKLFDYEMNKYVDIYDKAKAEGTDPYDFFLSGAKKGPMRIENPNQDNGKTLVIFRDSFGSSFAPLMVEGYSTIYVVDIRVSMAGMINNIVGGFEGKDVLFLASAMVVNDSSEFMKN